ncbi:hypothetical protein V6N13_008939 [Hibiscus sabdariffa]
MKLATVNPRLDFNIDNLYAKEVFPSCTTNFPTVRNMPSELANHPSYLHFNPIQQVVSDCGVEIGINSSDMALRRTIISTPCQSRTHYSSTHPISLECNKFNPLQHGMLNCRVFTMWSQLTGSLIGDATNNGGSNDRRSKVWGLSFGGFWVLF